MRINKDEQLSSIAVVHFMKAPTKILSKDSRTVNLSRFLGNVTLSSAGKSGKDFFVEMVTTTCPKHE
ncbi:hypothetical protein [Proteus faecis]|uniref:hypothetical protein n=1 Tax=Proteus faecis TaxID=2050967 RepID=UPI0021BA4E8B|nr:hypothetical protein [Proteus faecis]MCT8247911.1 hypothetical protein [Proteus faecis]